MSFNRPCNLLNKNWVGPQEIFKWPVPGNRKRCLAYCVLLYFTTIADSRWVTWDPKWPWAPWQCLGMGLLILKAWRLSLPPKKTNFQTSFYPTFFFCNWILHIWNGFYTWSHSKISLLSPLIIGSKLTFSGWSDCHIQPCSGSPQLLIVVLYRVPQKKRTFRIIILQASSGQKRLNGPARAFWDFLQDDDSESAFFGTPCIYQDIYYC